MSSDASGEIYVVMKENTGNNTSTSPAGTGAAPTATSSKPSGADRAYNTALVALVAAYLVLYVSVQVLYH